MLKALAGAVLLAATTAVLAQSPAQPSQPAEGAKPRPHARFDCSKAKDPKACEERRSKARETMKKAHAACENASDKRACMTKEMCAQSADPAKCELRAKERAEKRKERLEQRRSQQKQ
jgi:hypothetical protein